MTPVATVLELKGLNMVCLSLGCTRLLHGKKSKREGRKNYRTTAQIRHSL